MVYDPNDSLISWEKLSKPCITVSEMFILFAFLLPNEEKLILSQSKI